MLDLKKVIEKLTNRVSNESLMNVFYPIGSYYETSDTSFNPNTAWGGTWILETEGQVHISAGNGYVVSGALTNTSDGGTATEIFSDGQLAHGHGHNITAGTNTTGSHSHTIHRLQSKVFQGGTNRSAYWGSGDDMTNAIWADANGNHSHTVTIYGGVYNLSDPSNRQQHDNRPPYINVYRWHRTA